MQVAQTKVNQQQRLTWLWALCRVMKALENCLSISNNVNQKLGFFAEYWGWWLTGLCKILKKSQAKATATIETKTVHG